MAKELTEDGIVAEKLGLPEQAVAAARRQFNKNREVRAIHAHRLETKIASRVRDLEEVTPDDLKKLQGEIAGLRLAATLITKEET